MKKQQVGWHWLKSGLILFGSWLRVLAWRAVFVRVIDHSEGELVAALAKALRSPAHG
jgi:hypothetical protein